MDDRRELLREIAAVLGDSPGDMWKLGQVMAEILAGSMTVAEARYFLGEGWQGDA